MIHTDNPVQDAENYYCSLDRPDREGTVTFTLVLDIHARGRNLDELREDGFVKLKQTLEGIPYSDWDWTDVEEQFDEE